MSSSPPEKVAHIFDGIFTVNGIQFNNQEHEYDRITKLVPNLQVCDGDVLIANYAKCGTWWMKYILAHLDCDGDNDVVQQKQLGEYSEYLEYRNDQFIHTTRAETDADVLIRWTNPTKTPRLFNTHLHWKVVPPSVRQGKCKVILMIRNPKDVVVSFFNFYKSLKSCYRFEGTFDEFFDKFMQGGIPTGSGSFAEFYKSWWEHRSDVPMLVVHYEDMKRDLVKEIQRVAEFLNKPFSTEVIQKIAKFCSFENMKKAPSTQHLDEICMDKKRASYFRKGVVGDWKNVLTVKQSEMVDELIHRELGDTGIPIKYD